MTAIELLKKLEKIISDACRAATDRTQPLTAHQVYVVRLHAETLLATLHVESFEAEIDARRRLKAKGAAS